MSSNALSSSRVAAKMPITPGQWPTPPPSPRQHEQQQTSLAPSPLQHIYSIAAASGLSRRLPPFAIRSNPSSTTALAERKKSLRPRLEKARSRLEKEKKELENHPRLRYSIQLNRDLSDVCKNLNALHEAGTISPDAVLRALDDLEYPAGVNTGSNVGPTGYSTTRPHLTPQKPRPTPQKTHVTSREPDVTPQKRKTSPQADESLTTVSPKRFKIAISDAVTTPEKPETSSVAEEFFTPNEYPSPPPEVWFTPRQYPQDALIASPTTYSPSPLAPLKRKESPQSPEDIEMDETLYSPKARQRKMRRVHFQDAAFQTVDFPDGVPARARFFYRNGLAGSHNPSPYNRPAFHSVRRISVGSPDSTDASPIVPHIPSSPIKLVSPMKENPPADPASPCPVQNRPKKIPTSRITRSASARKTLSDVTNTAASDPPVSNPPSSPEKTQPNNTTSSSQSASSNSPQTTTSTSSRRRPQLVTREKNEQGLFKPLSLANPVAAPTTQDDLNNLAEEYERMLTPSSTRAKIQAHRDEKTSEVKELTNSVAQAAAAKARKLEEKKARELEEVRLREIRARTVIHPLTPEWEAKVDKVQAMKNPQTSIANTNLTRHDFGTLVPSTSQDGIGWLNDEIISDFLNKVTAKALAKTNRSKRADEIPQYHAFSSHLYTKWATAKARGNQNPYSDVSRWVSRAKIAGTRLLGTEEVLIPINDRSHWTLISVSGKRRQITYYDSFGGRGSEYKTFAREFVEGILGEAFVASEWTVASGRSTRQLNGVDCGAFVCANALALAKGLEPAAAFAAADMPAGRRQIAAVLLNGGFSGDFDF